MAEQAHDGERRRPAENKGAGSETDQAAGDVYDEDEDALEGDASAWMEDPPEGFGQQLSRFGILFTLLDGMVTESTLQYLRGTIGSGQSPTYPQVRLLQAATRKI